MGLSRFPFCSLLACAFASMPTVVQAQTVSGVSTLPSSYLSAQEWADSTPAKTAAKKQKADPYSVTGYDDGVFSLKPSLEIGAIASDNANFMAAGRQAGVGYELKPSLSFATAWPVHQWTGSASGSWTSFPTNSANDGLAGTFTTDFRLDIRRDLYANFDASAVVNESMAGVQQVPTSAAAARRDWLTRSAVSLTKNFGPVQSSVKLGVSRAAFGDVPLSNGTIVSNAAMNYVEPNFGLRGSFGSMRAPIKPYVEIDYVPRLHDVNGGQRDSQGVDVAFGMTFSDGPIWQGDLAAVAMGRIYSDSNLGSAFNGGVNGSLTWSPTALWSIVGSSSVALNESTIPGVAALPSWVLGVNATYALRENLYLHAGTTVTLASNGSGLDQTISASLGADYMFTRHLGVTGTAQSNWVNSSVASSRDEQRVMLGVLLKP